MEEMPIEPPRIVEWGIRLELALSRLVRRRIEVGGHRITYLDRRPSSSRDSGTLPIVMLHGLGGDKLNWVRYARHLTRRHRTVIPDLPGFGDSSRNPDLVHSIDNQADWLAAFLDALGIRQAHVAGNSMGGHIATRFAVRHPDRVSTLILFAPSGTAGAGPPFDRTALRRGQHPLEVHSHEDFDALMRWIFVRPPLLVGPVYRYFAARAVAGRAFTEKVFRDIQDRERGNALIEPWLPGMAMPTLVVWGDTDRLLDCGQAGVYERLMPDAQAVVVERCGHLPMAERPREMARLTRTFLERAAAEARRRPVTSAGSAATQRLIGGA
jgi:abhydrolase domain-containing protein 6